MGSGISITLLYVVIIGAFYFIAIRPQKKKEKEHPGSRRSSMLLAMCHL